MYKHWYYNRICINPKVVDSIPDEEIEIFNRSNAASRSMVLELTQPLIEINTKNFPGGGNKARPPRPAREIFLSLPRLCIYIIVYFIS
jgi:hypothetical protein